MNENDPFLLCIKDNSASREVVRVLLSRVMGFSRLEFFGDSTEFMRRVRALPEIPDLILMDIEVKPMNGYEMLHLLRNDSDYRHVRVIALTANVMSDEVNKIKQAGFSGLIGEPIVRRRFPELFKRILAGETIWYVS